MKSGLSFLDIIGEHGHVMEVNSVESGTTSNASPYVGINIGGTSCSVTLGDRAGRILKRSSWKTAAAPGPDAAIEKIAGAVAEFGVAPVSAGVAIGGPLNTETGTVLGPPNLPGWEAVPLRERLRERLGIPVCVAHDAAACALAEARFGDHGGARSLVYLTCGTGFGAGIVLDGHILEGAGGLHTEIGHWRLLDDGPEAFGRPGSAEALCSGRGLARIAAWRFPERWPEGEISPEEISRLASEGDRDALAVVDFHAMMTGRVCAKIAELLCPEKILLGSLAMHMGALWVQPVLRHYRAEVLPRIGETVTVEPAALRDRLQDLSALVVAM
jgi:glucokinase